jgi:peptide/nickel transport system permease protein
MAKKSTLNMSQTGGGSAAELPYETMTQMVWRRFKKHRLAMWSSLILVILIGMAFIVPLVAPMVGASPDAIDLYQRYAGMSWAHPFGTDELGRDVFLRLMYGGRISLTVAVISALAAAIIGITVGVIAGYFGGLIDALLMRFTDSMLSIPVLPLMIVFSALPLTQVGEGIGSAKSVGMVGAAIFMLVAIGVFLADRHAGLMTALLAAVPAALIVCGFQFLLSMLLRNEAYSSGTAASVLQLILIVVFFSWMTVARLVRAAALQIKELDFVAAAKAFGAPHRQIIFRHIIPNAMAPIIVAATLEVGGVILYESVLSFLGLGVKPPTASWGNMLKNALDYLQDSPGLAFWPGLFILITVVCFNFFGDGLRDALDPHHVTDRSE